MKNILLTLGNILSCCAIAGMIFGGTALIPVSVITQITLADDLFIILYLIVFGFIAVTGISSWICTSLGEWKEERRYA